MRNVQIVLKIAGPDGRFQKRKIRELLRQSAANSKFSMENGAKTNVAVRSFIFLMRAAEADEEGRLTSSLTTTSRSCTLSGYVFAFRLHRMSAR